MKASVIIPSYNANERLYLNLMALNCQSYDGHDVEVVVIDNGSNDNTMDMLKSFELKYPLKIIRVEKNRGIAYGRNEGVLNSEGEILIFHDSDMIASKDFIKQHLDAHDQPDTVVCGLFWKRIFTYYYKNFTDGQVINFEKIREKHGLNRLSLYWDAYPLIKEDWVKSEELLPYSFDLDFGFINDLKDIIREYGRDFTDYYLPWRFCITNNLSVEKQKVMDVGMFDTNIVRYGYEDYDLGVRLYKSGCNFVMADHIVSLHQEHPANYRPDDLVVNINYMCNKYNNIYFIDVPLVCMSDNLGLNRVNLNGIVKDIYKLIPNIEYHDILQLFLDVLQVIRRRLFSPLEDNGREDFLRIIHKLDYYVKKILKIEKTEDVTYFIKGLSRMLKQAFDIDFERLLKANRQERGGSYE
ncbi:MAG: glycosyltransferase family 2 protein [Clostridiaceae bacterium]|nr:glycosyltransferase family 2 protein [Clostridiaceae bacterium]